MMNSSQVDDIVENFRMADHINENAMFEYTQLCSKLLRHSETEYLGRKIIINVLDNWKKISPQFHEIWTDLIESAGFYPYLEKNKEQMPLSSTASLIRKKLHVSSNLQGKILHEEQYLLKKLLQNEKNLIVSAPTSFGKSLLIEEVVASLKYNNIVVIQPTLALLDETRKKLNKYKDHYKIIVRTTQEPSRNKRNLFLLTAERVMEYKGLPKIDFFIIDEFYKLSAKRDDERSDVLNNAANLLLNKHGSKFYLLGPNINKISDGFAKEYNAEFYSTNYSLVDNISIDVYLEHQGLFGSRGAKREYKEKVLFELLDDLKFEQSLIYCSSPHRARQLAKKYLDYLVTKTQHKLQEQFELIAWVKENISDKWSLISCLEYGIAFHDGALQKHISSTLVDYFNNNKISYLFCTSTIIEGVNTSAKNVIYFDESIGKNKEIDFFDYSNIKGRSGRMMIHYVGKIYNFNKPPKKQDIVIDIPFYEQNPISDEVLIQLDDSDVKDKNSEQYKRLRSIPFEERELFKKTGEIVVGQQKIVEILKRDIREQYSNIGWSRYPNYEQLQYVLTLGWNNLIRENENVKPMTLKKLVKVTNDYSRLQNIMILVENNMKFYKTQKSYEKYDEDELFDFAIREAFQTLRHWFQYKVPKWLNVVNELQKYVCAQYNMRAGDYSFYASQIENDFIRENLAILVEYGVPNSAVKKLESMIPSNIGEDEVLNIIRRNKYYELSSLIDYEKSKIMELF
ncbi:DEAD/DEAH box helicase [Paenibacillus dendritiformis]|uniref:DEAD/DEAH box helicase n=3 Tax=Paenibacillus dendritiformis TaxID=130049 RepID=UPI001FF09F40|nr:DEAD/DEAH box helicase [Paenibacillus dendritiformis]